MSTIASSIRRILIIKKLRKLPSNFEEISNYLSAESDLQEYDFHLSKRTFQRDITNIGSVYGVIIKYNSSRKVYEITHDELSATRERLFEAFDVFNALSISERISQHIHFEDRRPIGTEHLLGLLTAVEDRKLVKFTYHKFWENKFSERVVDPYALKEFRSRWYVLARDHKDDRIKSFALDRLSKLEITNENIGVQPEFDVAEHYKSCFGIVGPTGATGHKPEEVILSFTDYQGRYIKSLPLHHTQKVLVDTDEEFRISLKVFLTEDFKMELLSYTKNMKIMEPKNLVDEIEGVLEKRLS